MTTFNVLGILSAFERNPRYRGFELWVEHRAFDSQIRCLHRDSGTFVRVTVDHLALMRDPQAVINKLADALDAHLRSLEGPGWDANGSPVE